MNSDRRNRVFDRIYGCNAVFRKKTLFLTTGAEVLIMFDYARCPMPNSQCPKPEICAPPRVFPPTPIQIAI